MLRRYPKYYLTGFEGSNHLEAPLYKMSLSFDSNVGDYCRNLIKSFNKAVSYTPELLKDRVKTYPEDVMYPYKLIIIDASADNLPTGPETVRVARNYFKNEGIDTNVVKVDTEKELMKEASENPKETVVLSLCVKNTTYNQETRKKLQSMGCFVVPGKLTAPGGIFSNKAKTYDMFTKNNGENLIVPYKEINPNKKDVRKVVEDILDIIDSKTNDWKTDKYYVKPVEGGGALGGFRIFKTDKGYFIPDLSKVSGLQEDLLFPAYIAFDYQDIDRLMELVWIFKLFEQDASASKAYLKLTLDELKSKYKVSSDLLAIREHVKKTRDNIDLIHRNNSISREETIEKLVSAIEKFEKKYSKKYHPVVCKHMEFGTWGLRVHMRMSREGPKVEAVYGRIFQLSLTDEGIGYVGSDNISNKQTGTLEAIRCVPINSFMINALANKFDKSSGKFGQDKFYEVLAKAVMALNIFAESENYAGEPMRLQLDFSPVEEKLCEGNADPSRGLALASNFEDFKSNTIEYIEDILNHYSHMKSKKKN